MKAPLLPDNILKRISTSDRKAMGKAGLTSEEAALASDVRSERALQRLINSELTRRQGDGQLVYNWSRMDKKTTCKIGWPD